MCFRHLQKQLELLWRMIGWMCLSFLYVWNCRRGIEPCFHLDTEVSAVSRVIAVFCLFDLICILRDTMTHRGTKMSSWWSPTPRSPELHRRCFAWALSMQVCKMQMDLFRNPFLNLLTIRHRQLAAMSWPGYYTFFISFHIFSISVGVACSRMPWLLADSSKGASSKCMSDEFC